MKYIKGFDGIRGISIIFVLLTHLGLYSFLPDNIFMKKHIYMLISGTTGVTIFFALSGFLITRILLIEKSKVGTINLLLFYKKRFLRLLPPLVIFYTAIAFLMFFGKIHTTVIGFLFSIFYLYNFVPNEFYTGELGHTWSLAVEEQFYFTWPFVILLFSKKKTIKIGLLLILISILFVFLLNNWEYKDSIYLNNLFKVNRWFFPAVAPIITGSIASIIIFSLNNKVSKRILNIMVIVGLILYLSPLVYISKYYQISVIIQAIGISSLLVWVFCNQNSFVVNKVLSNRVLSFIGVISYGIYVYQGLFLRTGPSGNLNVQQFPLNIILVFVVSILSYYLLEKPVLKYKKRLKGNIN